MPLHYLALVPILILLSALFSGLTLGLMSLDDHQLDLILAGDDPVKRRQAERVKPLRKNGNMLLTTLLLGNTLVNTCLSIMLDGFEFLSGALAAAASTVVILIFGEIVPNSVCSRYGLAIGAASTEFVQLLLLLFSPVAWPTSKLLDLLLGAELATHYSRRELKELFSMQTREAEMKTSTNVAAPGGIMPAEAEWLKGALSLGERTAEQIMTPLRDTFCVDACATLDFELMRCIANSGHSRIPVIRRGRSASGDHHWSLQLQRPPRQQPQPPQHPMAAASNETAPNGNADGGAGGSLFGESAIRADLVEGLLTTKDLILMDPEDAVPVKQMLKHCRRDVITVWYDTPVALLFKQMKRGRSHLALVQRVNDEDEALDPFYEVTGIVTLEDVLEEIIQEEIVDESDVYVDNVTKAPVEEAVLEQKRRRALQSMLDPSQLHVASLTAVECEVVSSFLIASVPLFAGIRRVDLERLLVASRVEVVDGSSDGEPLYTQGGSCDRAMIVLQGRVLTVCGSEQFTGERGPWSLLAVRALANQAYVADFTATAVGPTRLLVVMRGQYQLALHASQQAEAAEAAQAREEAARRSLPSSPAPSLASPVTIHAIEIEGPPS